MLKCGSIFYIITHSKLGMDYYQQLVDEGVCVCGALTVCVCVCVCVCLVHSYH